MGLSKLGGSVNNKLKQGKKGAHLSMGYGKEGRELTYQWVTARKEGEISHKWVNGLMNSYHILNFFFQEKGGESALRIFP